MAHWRVKDEESEDYKTVFKADTCEKAEAWIANQEKIDKDKVHRGGYGIDGPCPDPGETIINEGGDEVNGDEIGD